MNGVKTQHFASLFVYSDELARFDFGPDHPFKPERATKTYDLCNRYGVINHPWMEIYRPEDGEEEVLSLYHEQEYLRLLREASLGKVSLDMLAHGLGTEDTPLLLGIYDWSLKAAWGTVEAMRRILEGRHRIAFNPLGGFHHGMPDHSEGFCYVNDIVVAILDAMRTHPGLKVLYIDLDAHHGNGVQNAFYENPDVFFISIHETGETLYPWSGRETEMGEGPGKGYTVNIPLEAGSDDEVYALVFDALVPPLASSFSPDIIVSVIGGDTLVSDPLTHLKLTNNGFQKAVKGIARLCPNILALGGGGYDIYKTARAWTLAWSHLNHVEPVDEFSGLVGGMMFGPESEVGSLYDHPFFTRGEPKERALEEARRVVDFLQREVFPIHGIALPKAPPS